MSLLCSFSCLKINRNSPVTTAFAQRKEAQTSKGNSREGKRQTKLQDLSFVGRENGFLKPFHTLKRFLSHLKASPVGC